MTTVKENTLNNKISSDKHLPEYVMDTANTNYLIPFFL